MGFSANASKNGRKVSRKGVPKNLEGLAKSGQRIRFNGFWLTEDPRDRLIADWLDETYGAARIIKILLAGFISGETMSPAKKSEVEREVDEEIPEELLNFPD